MDDIERSAKEGRAIELLTKPQDFLKFSEEMQYDEEGKIKENKYSNVGILIAGLAVEHYYNKGKSESERKTYNQILEEFILKPAGIEHFSVTPPEEGLFSDGNKAQRHICGSPAGGYWASTSDMQKFAGHICRRMQDQSFKEAVSIYGGEFYNPQNQSIEHRGELGPGEKSSAFFSVHIPLGTSCVMASNTDHSGFMGQQVSNMIASEQKELQRGKRMEALDLAKPDPLVSKLGIEKSSDQYRSFVERMLGDKTQGKSFGGSNEL